jgi:hypothetical protein
MGRKIRGSPIRCFEASDRTILDLLPEPVVSDQGFHWVWRGLVCVFIERTSAKVLYARLARARGLR